MSTEVDVKLKWYGNRAILQGKKATGKSAFEIGLIVEGQAKLLAPVNYGYLAASITTQAHDIGTAPDEPKKGGTPLGPDPGRPSRMEIDRPSNPNVVLVGTPVDYAPWQEFGTGRMEAQPFLRPALALARGQKLTILGKNGKFYLKEFMR